MPPPLEFSDDDDGSSTGGSIPYGDGNESETNGNNAMEIDRKSPPAPAQEQAAAADDDEEDEEDEEDVYVVERVMGHDYAKNGKLFLQVKWKGYDNPEDETMEPEENLLDGANDVLQEYYKKQGGRPEKPTKGGKAGAKKRKSLPEPSVKKETPKKRSKVTTGSEEESQADTSVNWVPKGKSWEKDVTSVETILRDKDGGLYAYLNWRNAKKSKISIETCYEKCPQKMLQFYEQHLVFKDESSM